MRNGKKQGLSSSAEAEKSRYQPCRPPKNRVQMCYPGLANHALPFRLQRLEQSLRIGIHFRNSFQLQELQHLVSSSSRGSWRHTVACMGGSGVTPPSTPPPTPPPCPLLKLAKASILPDSGHCGTGREVSMPHISPVSAWSPSLVLWKVLLLEVWSGNLLGMQNLGLPDL